MAEKELIMKKVLILLCLAAFVLAPARPKKKTDEGLRHLETSFHLYDSLQKNIFRLAETGYKEYKSVEQWTSFLESQGFSVERGVAGIPTAFVATYGSGAPVIGMMAEYDAIKGMSQDTVPYPKVLVEGAPGHACGHNLLGTGSVAGAVAVSKWLAAGHKGSVKLFGCPAEEGGGGKAYMMREGVFEGLDAMLDWHPDTRNTVNKTSGLANVQVRFTFHGKSSHASGAPDAGRSALDAVEAFDNMMNLMREHVPQTSRIHYVITDGGKAPNVVPDRASVRYFFRSPSRTVVKDLLGRALKAAEGAAMGTGTTMEYEILSGNYERLPNEAMASVVWDALGKVGGIHLDEREMAFAREMTAVSGVDAALIDKLSIVVPPSEEGYEAYVSSDVGNVTWAVPTGSFRYACFVPGGFGHSWQQVSSGGTTIGTKGAIGAAKVLYLSAVELLGKPAVLEKVRAEFLQRRGPDFVFEPMMGSRRPPFLPAASLSREMPSDIAVSGLSLLPEGLSSLVPLSRPHADTCGLDVFLPSSSVADQGESGRCWYFATANVLRGERSFSVVYPYFWDMMEKANLFLVRAWEHRGEALDSRYNTALFQRPTWDGGHMEGAIYLIRKYGLVPAEVMPETASSQDSGALRTEIRKLLRAYGLKMRQSTEPEALRREALTDVYRILAQTLGTPPSEFEAEGRHFTPAAYRDAVLPEGLLDEFVMLMNDPRLPYGKMYRVEGSRYAADAPEWTFLNLSVEDLEALGVASLKGGERFYFTCDTLQDALAAEGVYDSSLFPLGELLGVSDGMSKAERFSSRDLSSAHAMAMAGVKLSGGKVSKWVAENSFGLSRGQDGYIEMSAGWWENYLFRMAVRRSYLSSTQLRLLDQTPEVLPWWNLY